MSASTAVACRAGACREGEIGQDGAPSMNEQEIRAQLRGWIRENKKATPVGDLTDQTLLLETGLLTSLDIVEFVLFIEELRDAEVDPDDIEPEVFTSIDTLWEGFFAPMTRS